MPEIYADWKSLEPLTKRIPAGTKCVVIDREEQDKFVLGEVVTVEDTDACPYCSNMDGVCEVMRVIELALLPADYQAEQPAPTKPERKVIQITGSETNVFALCSDGTIWTTYPCSETWAKLPSIPQD